MISMATWIAKATITVPTKKQAPASVIVALRP
jgi:hypothetical protein